jgi:hypothetical protein
MRPVCLHQGTDRRDRLGGLIHEYQRAATQATRILKLFPARVEFASLPFSNPPPTSGYARGGNPVMIR